MATAQPLQDRVHLFRLQTLIIDGGTTVIRNIIHQKSSNVPFNVFLNHERTSVNTLKNKKTITQAQYNLLYPQGGNPPKVKDIDLTLATCLLRNLKSFGLNTKYNWSATPQQADKSVEADLCRLRNTRNEIAHIVSTAGIDQATFQNKWNEVEQVLLRLNNTVPNAIPNLQQELDEYKNRPLDPEAEEKIEEEIKKLQEMEKNHEMEVQIVKKELEDVKGNVKEVKEDIAAAHRKIDEELKMRRKTGVLQLLPQIFAITIGRIFGLEREEDSFLQVLQSIFNITVGRMFWRDQMQENLKKDLVALYRQQFQTLPLSPLIEEQDTPLLKFYIMPKINSVEIKRSFGNGKKIKSEVNFLRDVFLKNSKTCREIYLTADAGLGKTAFSRRLVLTWCQAKMRIISEQEFFEENDIKTMTGFEFVFLLSLRDCSKECDIDEMILKQIITRLAHTVTKSDIETILSDGKCLIILDGLDEWTHPTTTCMLVPSDIPHRKARECTVLTTTRPWKLSAISLKSSQIDQKLEIVGLNEESALKLEKSVISLWFDKPPTVDEHIGKFNSAVKDKSILDLKTTPLLLMYLLCLWHDGIDIGRSKCEIYCQIVELLLKRTFIKHPHMQQVREPPQSDIPQCFRELVHCKNYYTLLQALGQLAFETLFNEKRESTLAFSPLVTERYLNTEDMKLCLESGILTQNKHVKYTSQILKVSFSHKTVQEYFCALYISCQNENDVQNIMSQTFKSVQNILDMSTVFVFISRMNAEIISSISRDLKSVISEDQVTRTYRSIAGFDNRNLDPVKGIQNMYISCLKENTDNTSLCCQDFIFDEECQQENNFLYLKQLAIHNKSDIISLSINVGSIGCLSKLIDQCKFDDLYSVKKIHCEGKCKEAELIRLLTNKSLECVIVRTGTFIPSSGELSETFQNISQLRTIYIAGFEMEHDALKGFLNYIINRKSMVEIRLWNLRCVRHTLSCKEMNLDFSQHSHLKALGLSRIPVSRLSVNVSSLENCEIGQLSKSGLVTSFLSVLPAASNLCTVSCSSFESSGDIETMLQTLRLLVQVKHVMLLNINLGVRLLSLSSEMVNIERVTLDKVTMSALSLRNLVEVVKKPPHSVTVIMLNCNITPETEFANVKKNIKASENFQITSDGINQSKQHEFVFQTTKKH